MRAAWVIGWKDLRQRLRDRSALVVAFVAPVALATIISLAFGTEFTFSTTWILVDEDRSDLSRAFEEQVLGSPALEDQVTVSRGPSEEEARRIVESGAASAAFVFPEGFADRIGRGLEAGIELIEGRGDELGAAVARSVASAFVDQVDAARLAVATAIAAGADPLRTSELAAAVAEDTLPVQILDGPLGDRDVGGANYFGPSMAIFFLFFTVAFGARSLLVERRQGTLARLLAAPVSRRSVIAGKSLTVFVLGCASMATMFLFMSLVFGVTWGDPLAVSVLTVVTVLAVIGVTSFVGTLAKTDEQADSFASMASVTLGLVGGNFFPIHQMPQALQTLSYATPNGWAIRGFTDLVYDGAGLAEVLPHLGAIMAFAFVTGAVALRRARKVMVS